MRISKETRLPPHQRPLDSDCTPSGRWRRGQLYDDLAEDPLVFDDTFDALVVGPQVVVFGQRNFERGLGFLAAAQAEAEAVLRAATANLPIRNLDELVGAARSDVNMLAKLRSIAEKM